MTHKMYFIDPTFHEGCNTTVRRGSKWMLKLAPGDTLELRDADDMEKIVKTATVTKTVLCQFNEVGGIEFTART